MDQSADLYTYIHINVYVRMFTHHCGTSMHTPVQVRMSAVECIHTQLCRCVVSIMKCLPEQAVHKFVGNTIPCIEIVYGFHSFLNGTSVPLYTGNFQCSLHFPYTCVPLACCLIVFHNAFAILSCLFDSALDHGLSCSSMGVVQHHAHFIVHWRDCLIPKCIHSLTSAAVWHIRP